MTQPAEVTAATERTVWGRQLETPLRQFLATETGSAAVLLTATIAALIWANVHLASYESVWHTPVSLRLGSLGLPRTCTAGSTAA